MPVSELRLIKICAGFCGKNDITSIRGRLRVHRRKKGKLWTHFSAFEVRDNVSEEEVKELEGLFRHIYRKDTRANKLNRQKAFKKLNTVRRDTKKEKWMR